VPDNVDETGRLLSLAKATLLDLGVSDPAQHLILASFANLSTLIVGRAPFSAQDLARLRDAANRLGFSVLVSPGAPAASEVLRQIMQAPDAAALGALSGKFHLDVSPPTDERPFFFNQLRLTDPAAMLRAMGATSGVIKGNLAATITLLIIVLLSLILVVVIIILPALPSARQVSARFGRGTAYFLLIGFGFMFVEIGMIQRLSLLLGHPVYGLAVGLFAIILSTGIGSLLSDRWPISDARRAMAWCGLTALYLALLPVWLPTLVGGFEAYSITVRALVSIAMILPLGLLMGFGFPTGIRLANAIDARRRRGSGRSTAPLACWRRASR
jgi:hypothetical protein